MYHPHNSSAKRVTASRWFSAVIATAIISLSGTSLAQPAFSDQIKPEHTLTNRVLVFVEPGIDPIALGIANGVDRIHVLISYRYAAVFEKSTVAEALQLERRLWESPNVVVVTNDSLAMKRPTSFVPNDPFFPPAQPGGQPQFGQWHLNNTLTAGMDVNVIPAWRRNITGSGVVVSILDDGTEMNHEDLAPNWFPGISFNFENDSTDPSPVLVGDNHGTAVAGVAASRGGNNLGGTGAAPFASLGAIRILFSTATQAMGAAAIMYKSVAPNPVVHIKNHSYAANAPFSPDPGATEALNLSAAAGTIHVYAAGNERISKPIQADANVYEEQLNPNVITVAALNSAGTFASYSNFGANITCTTPSGDSPQFPDIVTADRMGPIGYNGEELLTNRNYTMGFDGTSSSSPLAAGVLALVKQVQPALDGRFAKHLIARFSRIVDENDNTPTSDGGWRTNAAGIRFNQNYGFGLLDADRLCIEAVRFTGVTPLQTFQSPVVPVNATIPQTSGGITRQFVFKTGGRVETMQVRLNLNHSARGDIEIFLTSPSGYTSRLKFRSSDTDDFIPWTFTSNAFWGEDLAGTWQVRVRDVGKGGTGSWVNFQIFARVGELIPKRDANLVWQNQDTGQVVRWAVVNGAITAVKNFGTVPANQWRVVAAGDMDHDGNSDLVWRNQQTGKVAVWRLDGSGAVIGTFVLAVVADLNWLIVDVADMNGDGTNDILWRNSASGLVVQWLMDSSGEFSSSRTVATIPAGWSLRAAKPIDSGSVADLVWQSVGQNPQIAIWFMNADGTVSSSRVTGATGSQDWQLRGVSRVMDTEQSLVFQNTATGSVSYWRLSPQGSVVGTGSFGTVPAGWLISATSTY